MKLEDIQEQWGKDTDIDRSELGHAALDIWKLHNKWYQIYARERLRLRKQQEDLKLLKREKKEFYRDGPTEEQHAKGWRLPARGEIKLKADIEEYVETDEHIIEQNLRIAYQQEKVNFLESIVQTISRMGFHINAAISWERFKVGS